MRVIEISNKTYLVRHWLRWYRVQRAGTDWQRLHVAGRLPVASKTLAETQASLEGKDE